MKGLVIQKGTFCIMGILDLVMDLTYSLWDLMTNVFKTTACYTSDGSLLTLWKRQQWFCDFQPDLTRILF
jgi:hypothetical protein